MLLRMLVGFLVVVGALNAKEQMCAVIHTNYGSIEVLLYPEIAPKACENFIALGRSGYYKNVLFHRVIPRFMIQGGDPTGLGDGGESIWETPFIDEISDSVNFDTPGRLAMANNGPNANGSQFFITTVPTPWLHKKHTIFGEVVNGFETVKKIESLGSQSGCVGGIWNISNWKQIELPRILRIFLKDCDNLDVIASREQEESFRMLDDPSRY